jgi:hypothetical protein
VNKLDVVDVDPASQRVYGTTWVTVFSPRTDAYSVGVTPNDGWGDALEVGGTAVASVGAPRAGRAGLTRRNYAIGAGGCERVPVQVWATKSFTANWSARISAGGAPDPSRTEGSGTGPQFGSDLRHPPGDATRVVGSFAHRLPIPELVDCVAFYAGDAYPLPGEVITRGDPVRLVLDQGVSATQWLQANGKLDPLLRRVQSYAERPGQKNAAAQQPTVFTGPLPLWGVMFHESSLKNDEGVTARNASLRRLDQSWRLSPDNRDEVLVVGRVAPPIGPAEEALTGPSAASKLWLKGLPGSEREPIPGRARQETWVRFYIPIK